MNIYWRLRHAVWDFREQLFVRLLLYYLHRHNTIYVHPTPCSAPVAKVVRLNAADEEPHTHVEGRG